MRGTLISVVLGIGLGLALLWFGQRRLIYLPFGIVPPLASVGLPNAEDVSFTTDDGETLGGWFVHADSAPARFTMIVFSGNAGNRSFRAQLAASFARHGVATLLFDYRGYGGNAGRPTEEGLARDARAALRYVMTRPGIDTTRIIYFGESLGAAVAIRLATEVQPHALVLRSPFTSLTEVGGHHYPFLPVKLMLRDRYPSIDRVALLTCPVLVIAGDRDSIIPVEQSKRIYEAITAPKELVIIPGADHNDEALFDVSQVIKWGQTLWSGQTR